jgi:hypothetical protein
MAVDVVPQTNRGQHRKKPKVARLGGGWRLRDVPDWLQLDLVQRKVLSISNETEHHVAGWAATDIRDNKIDHRLVALIGE